MSIVGGEPGSQFRGQLSKRSSSVKASAVEPAKPVRIFPSCSLRIFFTLLFAIVLLLPGGCFLVVGIGMLTEGSTAAAVAALQIAVPILVVMGLLFWFAFRRRPPSPPSSGAAP